MARFLLIHGAAHGAWCWRDVVPALQALGHEVQAIDLPSHGADTTPLADVRIETYSDAVLGALTQPAIVVGHSMGGYPISHAAERAPHLFTRLIYLCAYTPWPDHSLADMRKLSPHQPLLPAIQRNPDGISMRFDTSKARELFYHDCSDEAVDFAMANLCAQALLPQQVPVALGDAYASVPRSYIVCNQDGVIPPDLQRDMAARFAPQDVYAMDTSHSPFLSAPRDLAALLSRIAG